MTSSKISNYYKWLSLVTLIVSLIFLTEENSKTNNLKESFQKLISGKYFNAFELIGTKRKPIGTKVKASLATLLKLSQLPFVGTVSIDQIEGC